MEDHPEDNFRPEFKRYKKKSPPPCLKDVLDADDDGHVRMLYRLELFQRAEEHSYIIPDVARFGLKDPDAWQCYGAHGFPGFQFIRNPFLPGAQRYWVKRCMADYPSKPNVTNLDTHHRHKDQLDNPWQASREKFSSPCQTKEKTLMDQLRWVTLGYHYDWNNKVYNEDHHSPFPDDLGLMSSLIAEVLGYPSFNPHAAIVNFYHMDSTLGGHTDHSEFDLTAPLISYSLGQSAILLVGGKTKATKPLALHLRSGDVVILGGESRLAYHAVPRIMYAREEGQLPQCFDLSEDQQHLQPQDCDKGYLGIGGKESQETTSRGTLDNMGAGRQEFRNTTCDADVEHSGKPLCSSDSSAALAADPTKGVHSEQFLERLSPCQSCEPHQRLAYKANLEDTVSRTALSISAESQHADLSEVTGNISSAMKELSRQDRWREFEQYLKHARINISVRQVTGQGKGFPHKESCHEERDNNALQSSNAKRTTGKLHVDEV